MQPPKCKGTSCRMKSYGTRSHGILVQTRSPQAQSKYKHGGKLTTAGKKQTKTQTSIPNKQQCQVVTAACYHCWGYSSGCGRNIRNGCRRKMATHTGATYALRVALQKCSRMGCPAVQHAECSTDQTETNYWQCDDCLLENTPAGVLPGTGRQDAQTQTITKRTGKRQLGDVLNESPESRSRLTQ